MVPSKVDVFMILAYRFIDAKCPSFQQTSPARWPRGRDETVLPLDFMYYWMFSAHWFI